MGPHIKWTDNLVYDRSSLDFYMKMYPDHLGAGGTLMDPIRDLCIGCTLVYFMIFQVYSHDFQFIRRALET